MVENAHLLIEDIPYCADWPNLNFTRQENKNKADQGVPR